MSKTIKGWHLSVAAALIAGTASAQTTLEDRVTALEASNSASSVANKLEFYGYIKGDLAYDLDTNLGLTSGGLAGISSDGLTGENFQAFGNQTRLGVRYRDTTSAGDLLVNLEGDFFGANGNFRIRNAYGQLGNVLAGQFWTNFMPIESYPSTVDFNGPAGTPFARQTQLRYTFDSVSNAKFSVSVEDALFDSNDPVLTAAASYTGSNYFAKIALIGGTINGGLEEHDAFGVNISGNAQLWEGGNFVFNATQGEGIGRYLTTSGTTGTYLDQVVESTGVTAQVTQQLSDKFRVGVAYGYVENDIGAPDALESLQTAHLSLTYNPTQDVTYGIEYITGERESFAGDTASADRIQASFQFNF